MKRTAVAALLAIAVAGTLAGCTLESPSPAPTRAAETAAPADPAPARPEPITCDTLVPAAAREAMADDGWTLFEGYEEKLRAEGSSIVVFIDYGGAACLWGPPNGSGAVFAGSAIDDTAERDQRARLESEGYTVRAHNGADLYERLDETGSINAHLFVDDYWFYANTEGDVDLIRQNADLG
jgi:hypothetical protein